MTKKVKLFGSRALTAAAEAEFAAKLAKEQRLAWRKYLDKWFVLRGAPRPLDTYKRTQWAAASDIGMLPAAYHLTLRKGLKEPGADGQLIMAGHEEMLAQWFLHPLKREQIELASYFYRHKSAVKAFPHQLWEKVINDQGGRENIDLPVDLWGFPGGQTFLPGVPSITFEGMGGLISYLEGQMCRYYAPVIWATKGRIFGKEDAEFGLRGALNDIMHIALLRARYVGCRNGLTSNDEAEMMDPAHFQSIGTVGHEMMSAAQELDKSLGEAEREMMELATQIPGAKLLTDLVDPETIGIENAIAVMLNHPEDPALGLREDSGDIAALSVQHHTMMHHSGVTPARRIVIENEMNPVSAAEIRARFKAETGADGKLIIVGAGGYWMIGCHRDTVSAAFKRSFTNGNPNLKFSKELGKGSLPGRLRVYERGDTLVIADASECIDGKPLFVQLVRNGRIVYHETLDQQADRADATWGKYKRFELSPLVRYWKETYDAMRKQEIEAAKERLSAA